MPLRAHIANDVGRNQEVVTRQFREISMNDKDVPGIGHLNIEHRACVMRERRVTKVSAGLRKTANCAIWNTSSPSPRIVHARRAFRPA